MTARRAFPFSRGAGSLLFLIALCAPSTCRADALKSYDLFPTAVTGSARDVGLAGAVVANPSDYDSVFINPAGVGGLCGTGVDFGSDSNQIDNFVVDLSNPKSKALNDPINFSFYGFRFVSDDGWGFGMAKQTPTKFNSTFNGNVIRTRRTPIFQLNGDQTQVQVNTNVYTLAVGKTFYDRRLSLGLGFNYIQVNESYDFNPISVGTAPIHQSALSDALAVDIGVVGRPWSWLQMGAVYKMGYLVPFDASRNPPSPLFVSVAPFRTGKSPDRITFGLDFMPHRRFNIYAQSSYVHKMPDTSVVGSGVFPGGGNIVAIGDRDTLDGHWGIEYIPLDEPDLTFKFWAGGYLEDTGIQGGYTRYHRTAGFSFDPWFWNLNMAVDDTELYNNFSVGLGVDLLQFFSRLAKHYGWKLPV